MHIFSIFSFVVLLFVYIVGGVIFQRYVRGASGKEVIPNVGFWEEFPLLVKVRFELLVCNTLTNSPHIARL